MNSIKVEEFIRNSADFTLRECYRRLGEIQLAEYAFIEVYVAWYKNRLSRIKCIRPLVLKYEISKVCNLLIN